MIKTIVVATDKLQQLLTAFETDPKITLIAFNPEEFQLFKQLDKSVCTQYLVVYKEVK
jgi:hypothetical protein